jgi:hypothetical protein
VSDISQSSSRVLRVSFSGDFDFGSSDVDDGRGSMNDCRALLTLARPRSHPE